MDSVTDLPPMTALLADHVAEPPPALHTNHPHPPYPKVDLIPNPVASHARSHRRSPDLTESPICLPIQFAGTIYKLICVYMLGVWYVMIREIDLSLQKQIRMNNQMKNEKMGQRIVFGSIDVVLKGTS
ncbi:hypothetical protein L2E82_01608 [Cichorium intybus]|uniref:Uncharacterized protein n=1 Tax=Cichorium intybus TaxID=13427 RepID=A0ACB9H0G2_CICIN|nr:hypothetical protein L2E82_01608 [Cichorium intybus]